MTGGLRIERASSERIDEAGPLFRQMVEHHRAVAGGAWPVRRADRAWERRRNEYEQWLRDGRAVMLLAMREGGASAIGYTVVSTHPSGATWEIGDRVGELESLAVAEEARGQGVGAALVAAAREVCRKAGVSHWIVEVVDANAGAIRMYERHGFQPYYRMLLAKV